MDAELTITVRYSCFACRVQRAHLEVVARGTEDVTTWMDATVRRVAQHHRSHNPRCQATELSELLVPLTGTDRVGGAVIS